MSGYEMDSIESLTIKIPVVELTQLKTGFTSS